MKFNNDSFGRSKVLDEIGALIGQGYTRRDYLNSAVVMSRLVAEGKRCSHFDVVRYSFDAEKQEISKKTYDRYDGVRNVKENVLLGWSSPKIEVENAVKAGLINAIDASILKKQYSDKEWAFGE